MIETKQTVVCAQTRQFKPANHNCYDYFLINTDQYGDYVVFKHGDYEHLRSEFLADVEALAAYFKLGLGLNRGDVFTSFMPTSIEGMITFMALNKIGVIVNFVHPLLPSENLKELMIESKSRGIMLLDSFIKKHIDLLEEMELPCLICVPSTYAIADKYQAKGDPEAIQLCADRVKTYKVYCDALKEYSGQIVEGTKESKDDTAVYMNGGGTTGKSRTIMLPNNALNYVIYMLGAINTPIKVVGVDTELCTMPFFHAFGFCAGGLSAMHKGAKVVFLPQFDVDKFVYLMRTNKVVEFNGVPNMYKKLLAHPDFDGPHLKDLKVMYCGGDDLPPAFLDQFQGVLRKNGSTACVCQGYGLTECCAVCVVNSPWENKQGSIGKALPFLRAEIWDENNKKVPNGTIGQIALTGPTLMKGYLNPEGELGQGLYTDEEGTKWVLTGDLGKLDDEGYITFIGRIKRVIIISGYNIYPVDIEKLLVEELDFIKECCAVQGFVDGKKLVRLYTVLEEDGDKEEYKRMITDLCTQRLSKFSVPRDIVFIDELPRTRVQKVDFMSLTQLTPEDKINY